MLPSRKGQEPVMERIFKLIFLFVFIFFSTLSMSRPAYAEADWASVTWHNDLFAGKDGGGYTNGLYISWYDLSNEGESELKPPLLVLPLTWMQDEMAPLAYSAHTLGQAMITPDDISKEYPDPNDAPYAGLLLFTSSYITVQDNVADAVSTIVGVMGPASGAEKSQKFIHKVIGSRQPQGWDSQLGNQFIWQFSRAAVWRFSAREFSPVDAVILADGAIGNLESSVGGGLFLRVGDGLEKSFSTITLLKGRISNPMAVDGGWYFYIGGTAGYLHNQILLDGNDFFNNRSSELKHDQYSLMAGFSYSWENVSINFSYQNNSALDNQPTTARQEFGAIAVAWKL